MLLSRVVYGNGKALAQFRTGSFVVSAPPAVFRCRFETLQDFPAQTSRASGKCRVYFGDATDPDSSARRSNCVLTLYRVPMRMRRGEVSMKQRWKFKDWGKKEDHREKNPPTSGIVGLDSHKQKSRGDLAWETNLKQGLLRRACSSVIAVVSSWRHRAERQVTTQETHRHLCRAPHPSRRNRDCSHTSELMPESCHTLATCQLLHARTSVACHGPVRKLSDNRTARHSCANCNSAKSAFKATGNSDSKWGLSGSVDRAIPSGVAVAQWIERFQVGSQWLTVSPLVSHQGEPGSILPDFRKWESCHTMPLVGGFSLRPPVSLDPCIPALLHSHLISLSSALKTSREYNSSQRWFVIEGGTEMGKDQSVEDRGGSEDGGDRTLRTTPTVTADCASSFHPPPPRPGPRKCSGWATRPPPPTKANGVRFPAGLPPDFRMRESCRTMPLVGGFYRGSPVSPPLHSGAAPYLPRFTLIGSQDLIAAQISSLYFHPPPS
ncbi:hypothetical protein PR048_027831 [Dryococelus australis]|uniref:Uncharacterized protein n=1 Tax=Dryococelus australis TaxID=614101 RepID=A0ABQ9GHN3_9NEOP|nr:hypothetical protein PR048_027831 [Dryococelus australis]